MKIHTNREGSFSLEPKNGVSAAMVVIWLIISHSNPTAPVSLDRPTRQCETIRAGYTADPKRHASPRVAEIANSERRRRISHTENVLRRIYNRGTASPKGVIQCQIRLAGILRAMGPL